MERHNLVLQDILDKIIGETYYNIDLYIAWCINAENSLTKVHGFCPFKLAIEMSSKLPSLQKDQLSALTTEPLVKLSTEI